MSGKSDLPVKEEETPGTVCVGRKNKFYSLLTS